MSTAISVRVQPMRASKAGGQAGHDLRQGGRIPGYVDEERIEQNSVLLNPPNFNDLYEEIAQHRKQAKQQKMRKDARIAVSGVITFGTESQPILKKLSIDEQNNLFLQVAKEIENKTGHSLLSLVVHRDESALHAHFMLRGYKYDEKTGKESAWNKKPSDLKALQDTAANCEIVKKLGITRGISKKQRLSEGQPLDKVIHKTVRELHYDLPRKRDFLKAAIDLEIKDKKKEREEIEAEISKLKKYDEELKAKLMTNHERLQNANRKLKELSDVYNNAEGVMLEKIQTLQKRVATYEKRVSDTEKEKIENEQKLLQLQQKIQAIVGDSILPPGWNPPVYKVPDNQGVVFDVVLSQDFYKLRDSYNNILLKYNEVIAENKNLKMENEVYKQRIEAIARAKLEEMQKASQDSQGSDFASSYRKP